MLKLENGEKQLQLAIEQLTKSGLRPSALVKGKGRSFTYHLMVGQTWVERMRAGVGFKPRTFFLWGNRANHWARVWRVCASIVIHITEAVFCVHVQVTDVLSATAVQKRQLYIKTQAQTKWDLNCRRLSQHLFVSFGSISFFPGVFSPIRVTSMPMISPPGKNSFQAWSGGLNQCPLLCRKMLITNTLNQRTICKSTTQFLNHCFIGRSLRIENIYRECCGTSVKDHKRWKCTFYAGSATSKYA